MGLTKISQGYVWVKNRWHPKANRGYVKRAILVLEQKLGRELTPEEMSHHIDGNRMNDDPANLEVTTRSEHMSIHKPVIKRWDKNKKHRTPCSVTVKRRPSTEATQ